MEAKAQWAEFRTIVQMALLMQKIVDFEDEMRTKPGDGSRVPA